MSDTLTAPETVTAMRVVGQRVAHHDFVDKVKGSLHYAADWQLPGMLHARLVRSLVPSARIVSIDTKEALALPGVAAVLTGADVPRNSLVERASGGLGELLVPMPILAAERVRYVGEPVAVVAAVTQQVADEAAELVAVTCEELPGLFDMEAALEPGAPLVHDEGNVLVSWHIGRGHVDAALAAADVVVEGTYRTQHVEHAYLEPEAGVGWMDGDVVTVRASTQVIEHAAEIAEILDLPASRVRVIAAYMGGGFGGKEDMTVEPFIALLVWKTRRPVRMIWDRQESMLASTKRHPFRMRYRTGAGRDGTILAQDIDLLGDAGAYPYLSARILFAGAALSCGPYRVPNVRVRARPVFTNNVPTSAFRGFGAMQVTFGYESQMDRVAAALGMDPAELRRRNFLRQGDVIPTGETLDTAVAVGETLRRALGALGDRSEPSAPGRLVGRGFACNMQPYGRTIWFRDRAAAWLTLQADGSLLIRSGVTDLGAGQAASLCQLASEVLGVPLGDISVYIGDTALTPPAGGTFATRQLYMSGNAVLNAARDLRARIDPVAADLLGCSGRELRYSGGLVRGPGSGGSCVCPRGDDPPSTPRRGASSASISLAELARACDAQAVDLSCLSTWRAGSGTFDPATGQGASFPDYTYGTHAAEVEVDPETGEVRVLRYVASHDVGRAINPMRVEGQIQGGAMQGLGYALTEEIVLEHGLTASSLFSSYFIPTALDMPDVEVEIVESGEGKGPFNARGIGEPPVGPVAPAIASAIADATGCRPARLPMTAERVLALLDEAGAHRQGADHPPA
ncbi:MAG TPA: xanthine dehydrogenase family protein molybdopterin-binding subunit [Streptosporangiaceae bacterium]|nr:xanthine dehydrogenase family protein molybdopterin-binding subunit [Streptosporangiaceae bacterium]